MLSPLLERWQRLAGKAKGQEWIPERELFEIFRDTRKEFAAMEEGRNIPREACRLLMWMDEFLYYATMLDDTYLSEYHSGLFDLNYAFKKDFFRGEYDSEFFIGEYPDCEPRELNLETGTEEEFIRFLRDDGGGNRGPVLLTGFDGVPSCQRERRRGRVQVQHLCAAWRLVVEDVLDRAPLSERQLQALLLETYRIFTLFCKDSTVFKNLLRVWNEMEEFLHHAQVMEENEVGSGFYHYEKVLPLILALKNGFLDGTYLTPFPHLSVPAPDGTVTVDLERDFLQELC